VASAASLARYAGLAPIRCGTAGNYYHRVNPRGDRQLNAIFHRIAQVQSRHNPLARAYLAKKKAEGKTSKQAFRCRKRRMVDIVYAVWKSGQAYQVPTSEGVEAA
jgi:transposase